MKWCCGTMIKTREMHRPESILYERIPPVGGVVLMKIPPRGRVKPFAKDAALELETQVNPTRAYTVHQARLLA